jgi:hypothetical protein
VTQCFRGGNDAPGSGGFELCWPGAGRALKNKLQDGRVSMRATYHDGLSINFLVSECCVFVSHFADV